MSRFAFVWICICNLLFATTPSYAGNPVIFQGSNARMLPSSSLLTKNGQNVIYNGQVNYILNQGAEGDGVGATPANWSTYADAAGTSPVDCTGGSSSMTWTANATTPLRNLQDFKFAKGSSNRQGDGVAASFTLSGADTSKLLAISFDVNATDANYVSSDLRVYVYDVTNSTLITPSNNTIPAGFKGTFSTAFATTTSTSYRFCIHQAGTNATADNVYFDNFYVGPGSLVQGAAVSDWQAYTPTGSWVSNTTYTGYYRRDGSNMDVKVGISLSGAPTSASLTVNIPSGYTINTSLIPVASPNGSKTIQGTGALSASGYFAKLGYNSTTSVGVFAFNAASTYLSDTPVTQAAPITWGSGDVITLNFTIPINEWAGNSVLNTGPLSGCEYAYNTTTSDASDTTSFGYGPAGNTIPSVTTTAKSKRVQFLYNISPTDVVGIQADANNVGDWGEVPSTSIGGQTATTGIGWVRVASSSTQIDVTFASAGTQGTANASAQSWSSIVGAIGSKWRAYHCSAPNAVGFGTATGTLQGLTSSFAPIVGSNTKATSANYTITSSDGYSNVFVTAGSSADVTIGLPAVASSFGRQITIKKVDNGSKNVIIDPNASETIDGATTNTLHAQYSFVTLTCDGSEWKVTGVYDYIQAIRVQGSELSITNNTTTELANATISPGTWFASGEAFTESSSAASTLNGLAGAINTQAAAALPGQGPGQANSSNRSDTPALAGVSSVPSVTISPFRVLLSSDTIYSLYIQARYASVTGSIFGFGFFNAIRVN